MSENTAIEWATHSFNPDLIAKVLQSGVSPVCGPVEAATIAAQIVQAHEIAAQIARMDREEADGERDHVLRRQARAAERRAVQERCGHPVTTHQADPCHTDSWTRCDVCGAEVTA